jgi:hypothetical protein
MIVLIFLVALLAVSVRIFLPTDMAQPAPIETGDTAQLENQNVVSFASVNPQIWG